MLLSSFAEMRGEERSSKVGARRLIRILETLLGDVIEAAVADGGNSR